MRIQEEYIVPGLGVVILLSVFGFATSGASLIYLMALALLGLAAVGTYFLPHTTQVEVRVIVAVFGLLIMVFYFSNLAFWLALLAFGAMGALQIRHSDALQTFPQHTVAWAKGKLGREVAMGMGAAEAGAGDEAGQTTEPAAISRLPSVLQGRLRANVGGIGASILGTVIMLCILATPWVAYTLTVEFLGETETFSQGVTFMQASRATDLEAFQGINFRGDDSGFGDGVSIIYLIVLVAVALVTMASVVLPRVAVISASIAGMAMMALSFVIISVSFAETINESITGVEFYALAIPHVGFFMTGGAFLTMAVLQVIPAFNGSKAKGAPPTEG